MANLVLCFSDVYQKVSEMAGWGSSPSAANLVKAKDLVYRGYRSFLNPINPQTGETHNWSFLKRNAVINTIGDKWEYELPADFGRMTMMPRFGPDEGYGNPQTRSVAQLYELRNWDASSGYPQYVAVQAKTYDPIVGQRYSLLIHPPADGVYPLHYGYVIEPAKLVNATDVFVGGALTSEAILESCLAAVERWLDGKLDVHTAEAEKLINQLIQSDGGFAPDSVGMNNDPGAQGISLSAEEVRNWRTPPLTSVYGISV